MHVMEETIRRKLEARLAPLSLTVVDDSARHAGHAGAQPGGGTHFSVTIVSAVFEHKKPVERHRLVYEALGDAFKDRLHALSIRALAPSET